MVTHDFLQPQLSPTVNLFIMPTDYLRLLKNLEENLKAEPVEVKSDKRYPVGVVNGVEINFMHYSSFVQAKDSWEKRAKRIKWDNMLVIFVERDGCTEEQLREFDGLSFKNKIAIVHRHYPNLKCELVVPVPSGANEVGKITDWANLFGKREYDVIDWVKILNNIRT